MTEQYSRKIDIYTHVLTGKYYDALCKLVSTESFGGRMVRIFRSLFDLEERFRVMDRFPGLQQVITLSSPPLEGFTDVNKAVEFAKLANDEMAELVSKYPDRFITAVATLPLNNIEASMKELDRTIKDLKFRGIQLNTPINDRSVDSPEYLPIYEKMSQYNLPIWIHPYRERTYADYRTEKTSLYNIFWAFGWPYETSVAMSRLAYSGILDKFPNLKIITHHCGGMIPYFQSRLTNSNQGYLTSTYGTGFNNGLTKSPLEYFKMFYADTAVGKSATLTCGLQFFGVDHVLFGTDMPYDQQLGDRLIRETINAIEEMELSADDKYKIYEGNAKQLLRLPL